MALIGYARVSTSQQENDEQIDQLTKAGCVRNYQEKISGKNADRPELNRMLQNVRAGDVLVVAKLDRLARSTLDLLSILDKLTNAGIGLKVLDNPALDTTSAHGKLLFDIMAAIGEFERKMIRARTEEGKARARLYGTKSGKPFGRPSKMTRLERQQALQMLAENKTLEQVAAVFNVHFTTISRLKTQKLSLEQAIQAHSNGEIRRGH